jgi:beta-N-acetylhexosaminidase
MKGRIAGFLLFPLLFFMANNARSRSRSPQQGKRSTKIDRKAVPGARRLSPDAEKWVEATLRKMTLDEKVGQLLFTVYHGSLVSTDRPAYTQLEHDVEQLHVGGFINATVGSPLGVVKSQAYPTAVLDNQLQSKARIPLLIGADFERGTAMRLDEGTSFPTAMALAAAGRPEDAYAMGKITALEARAVGIHWIYAPDADVNNNPANPIINTRSFGEDPVRVSEFVTQFIRGVEENGGLATAKHFPGHGDTATDSHIDLPVIHAGKDRLDHLELVPFRAAIASGVSTIMTGHLQIPALEPDPDTPATLSSNILTDLLRKQLGFEGLIVTDAMDMGGITVRYAPGEAAVRAVLAGADCILMSPVPNAAFEALKAAVASGRIPRQRLNDSVRRILRAKARLGFHKNRLVDVNAVNSRFATLDFERVAQDISSRGVTLLRDTAHRLPFDPTKPTRALLLAAYGDPEPYPAEDLERELRWRVDTLVTVRTDTKFVKAQTVKLPPPESYDIAVVAIFVRVSDRKGNVVLPAEQVALVQQVFASGKPVVCIGFGSPYLIEDFPQAQTWLAAFGISDVAQISAARALFGQNPIGGRLPVSIPALNLKTGDGIALPASPMTLQPMDAFAAQRLQQAFDAVTRAVNDKAFPGAVLAVGYQGKLAVGAFGKLSYDADSPATSADTIYDIASLSKIVSTTTLTARLAEGDFNVPLDLDLPIERYLPEWKTGPQPDWRHQVTARHLLTHTSGLPPFKDYWRTSKSKADTLAKIFAEPLEYQPGTKEVYSDLGVILMAEIVERLTGQPLDALARQQIFTPLSMKDTQYNPPKKLWPRIAPTEFDANLRKRLVRGEVHDENAYAMGGVAGHAGLFSTAPDLAVFCQLMLNGGIYAHKRLLRRSTVSQFTVPEKLANGARTLGWVVPTEGGSSGHFFSPLSFGHTGFTGTSIWIDPERQLFVILLTNRVHPTRENHKIADVRIAVHDAVMQGLGFATAAVSPR